MTATHVTEAELVERSQYPRVTMDALEANIRSVAYDYEDLTIKCTIVLQNGFSVHGVSACAVPGNYKRDVGERLALADAKNKIWALMGYELKTKVALAILHGTREGMETYVGQMVGHATPMTRGAYNEYRGWTIPDDEDPLDEGYLVVYPQTGHLNWQPKEAFEAIFTPMPVNGEGSVGGPTWKDRLEIEKDQLVERLDKLTTFLSSPLFDAIDDQQKALLNGQMEAMSSYLAILKMRLGEVVAG